MQPQSLYYQLSDEEDKLFDETIKKLTEEISYARYEPMTYYTGDDFNESAIQGQKNLSRFMKILLIKRLESSFFAFKKSISRFLDSYETFIDAFEQGNVYISKKHASKILDYLDNDDQEAISKLLEDDKAKVYEAKDFKPIFIEHLKKDKEVLQELKERWFEIRKDPKLKKFIEILDKDETLKNSHLIIFTESKETARYLTKKLDTVYPGEVICFDGDSKVSDKEKVINNFDASVSRPEDKFRILVTTEILAEGVNLHRSNVVINYDIPWNPTRLMQRVGRINRIDTKFEKIYTFNFFPSVQGNNQIALKQAAEGKIAGFLTLLGADATLLTDGEEITSHSLFERLNRIEDDEEPDSELKYLQVIKDIRENNPDLFDHIKRLPRKARTAKENVDNPDSLITYFRRGGIQKFFIANQKEDAKELDFADAAKLIESVEETKKERISPEVFGFLDKNNLAFEEILQGNQPDIPGSKGRDSSARLLKILEHTKKHSKQFTEYQDSYLKKVIKQLNDRGLPKKTVSSIMKSLASEEYNPLNVIKTLQICIPERLLQDHYSETNITSTAKTEVILSMYFKNL
jgi:superfamily II DNA/RNA helicase